MMKRTRKQSMIGCGALVALLLMLTACGGGGGFTSPGAVNVRALDPELARTYFAGSTVPGLTAEQAHSQLEQRIASIQGSANPSLRLSDISLFTTRDDLGLPGRVNATCSATTCTYTIGGVPIPIRVDDFSLNPAASFRSVMRYRGIPLVGRSEAMIRTGASYPGWLDYSRFPFTVGGGGAFGYGGWLDHSGFFVEGLPIPLDDAHGVALYYGLSFGTASNSPPTSGNASWNGVMVATDISGAGRENIIQGDADLSVDFGAATVDLSFSNVWDLNAGTARTGTAWSDMPVTAAGEFSGTNAQGETAGRFYGPAHEEAGGTFTYDDLAGAYGLKRQ